MANDTRCNEFTCQMGPFGVKSQTQRPEEMPEELRHRLRLGQFELCPDREGQE